VDLLGVILSKLTSVLLFRSGEHYCCLPVEHVVETFRPLPTQRLGDAPPFVKGLARLRGEAVPVLDFNRLLGDSKDTVATRYISLRLGDRRAILAVEEVLELRDLDQESMKQMPPLLADGSDTIASIGILDHRLLLLLQTARLFFDLDLLAPAPVPS